MPGQPEQQSPARRLSLARLRSSKALALVTGIALSAVLSYVVRDWEQASVRSDFRFVASTQAASVKTELAHHIEMIASLGGLYRSSQEVERSEFRSFVENGITAHPDVQAVMWAPRVGRDGLAPTISAAQRDGLSNFRITEADEEGHLIPVSDREEYHPVVYVEPLAPNRRLLGYDLTSDPLIGPDLARIRDSGRLGLTENAILGHLGQSRSGALLIQPVFRREAPDATLEQRRRHLSGFLIQMIRIGGLINEALSESRVDGIDIRVYDKQVPGGRKLLHHFQGGGASTRTPPQSAESVRSARSPYEWGTDVQLPGVHWSLVFSPTAAYLGRHMMWRWWIVLLIGLGVTGILYLYLRAMGARAHKSEALVLKLAQTNQTLQEEMSNRHRAEEGQHRLSAVLEATSDVVCMTDRDGWILFINDAGRELLGIRPEDDLSSKNLTDLYPDREVQRIINEAIPQLMRGEVWSGETAFVDCDGREIPVSQVLITHLSPAGDVDYFSTIVRDISERVAVEKQIRDSEFRLAEAQRIAHLGNWEWDIVSGALSWSDEIYRIFGVEPQQFEATYDAFLNTVHPDDRDDVVRAVDDAVHKGSHYGIDHRIVRPDGEVRIVHEQGQLTFDAEGRPIRMLGTVQDVTEGKKAEAALQQEMDERRNIEAAIDEVVDAVSSTTGDDFFRILVKRLTETLQVDYAFIGKLADDAQDVIETVAVCADGEILDNFSGSIGRTPCQSVLETTTCFCPHNVQEMFPGDGRLARMNIQSYLGVPLFDSAGTPLGLVAVMSRAPMEGRQPGEAILHIYATRIAAELQHKAAQEKISDLIKFPDENPSPVLRVSHDGVLLYANPSCRALLDHWMSQPGEKVPETVAELCRSTLDSGVVDEVTITFNETTYSMILAPSSHSGYVNLYARDITDRLQQDAQMRKLSSALEQSADSVMITDPQGIVEYVNPAFTVLTGYEPEDVIGRGPGLMKSGRHDEHFYKKLWETITRGDVFQDVFINRRKNGELYYEEKTITPLRDARGRITNFVSNGKDITDRMQTEERIHRLAYHDILTDLPNRALLQERLAHAVSRHYRDGDKLALLFLDLDHFKTINDTLGHDIGDALLQALPERLGTCLRKGDTIARLGGDEFAILLEDAETAGDASHVALNILRSLSRAFLVDRHELFISASIGIGLYPDDSQDVNTLLKHADTAMYRAKDLGRNTYQFYSAEMSAKAFERLSLETSLRYALEREQYELYYQPQVDVATGAVIGAEALLRWQNPELGTVSPMKFIPLLEETGLIVPVGEWILRTACMQAAEWQRQTEDPFRISVNLSGRQFHHVRLVESVQSVLDETGVDPQCLELEITESVVMEENRTSTDNLNALLEMGVRLAIDDFGTGYSSLAYLKRFPVDTLKIDRSFVHDITDDSEDATIVNTIVVMAHSLNLHVVAEGVETEDQLLFLRHCGCDAIQGYFCSKPLRGPEMTRLLEDRWYLRAVSSG